MNESLKHTEKTDSQEYIPYHSIYKKQDKCNGVERNQHSGA